MIGSLVRIGPNMLLTDDPVLLRRINAARSLYSKGEWYDGVQLDPDINNTISEKDEQKHLELRAKVANGVCIPLPVSLKQPHQISLFKIFGRH